MGKESKNSFLEVEAEAEQTAGEKQKYIEYTTEYMETGWAAEYGKEFTTARERFTSCNILVSKSLANFKDAWAAANTDMTKDDGRICIPQARPSTCRLCAASTRPSTSSPLVLARLLSATSRPSLSASLRSSSTLPRVLPTAMLSRRRTRLSAWLRPTGKCTEDKSICCSYGKNEKLLIQINPLREK